MASQTDFIASTIDQECGGLGGINWNKQDTKVANASSPKVILANNLIVLEC